MEELGLVTLQTSGSLYQIHLREIAGKVNLDDSVLLQKIRNQREKEVCRVSEGHRLDKKVDHSYEELKRFCWPVIVILIWKNR